MLNLVVGEIVNNATKIPEEVQDNIAEIEKDVHDIKLDSAEITLLRREVQELKYLLMEERNERVKKSS
jgi:voltage-gated sodium channel